MEEYIFHYYIILILFIILSKSYFNYWKSVKKQNVLLSMWAMPISLVDIALYVFMVYIIGDTVGNNIKNGYSIAIMYALCLIIMNILNSKLLISDGGIYFMSQFTSWENIDEIILVNDSVVNVRRVAFLSSGYKIRQFKYDDDFLSIVEKRCTVRK